MAPDILCIGSVLWDMIGRAPREMRVGSDVPGRITRLPGGVTLNIAMTLARFGLNPALLSVVGRDPEGEELMAACAARGMLTDWVYRSDDLPTDRYMAIEGANGLIAAVADAHSLEAAGAKILDPLTDGRLAMPWRGLVVLDGNLTVDLLDHLARTPVLEAADLRVAPASPGKAERLLPFVTHRRGTLYVNLEEAGTLCQTTFQAADQAAAALVARGAPRALVTDGDRLAADGQPSGVISARPPSVPVSRITGAGDTFMAAHIAAENGGANTQDALDRAVEAAARYVSGDAV